MHCLPEETITELAIKTIAGEVIGQREQTHLDACETCRQAVASEAGTAGDLLRALRTGQDDPPGPCLSDNDLAEYAEGALDEADEARVEAHLAACGACIASLAALDSLIQVADSARSPVRYVLRLAQDGIQFLTNPDTGFRRSMLAYVPTLKESPSQKDLCAWTQHVEGHMLRFKLQPAGADRAHLTVSIDSRTIDPVRTTVTLWKDGDLVQSQALSSDRSIRFTALDRGNYAFHLESDPGINLRVELDLQ